MPKSPFVPDDFNVPKEVVRPGYRVRLLEMSDLAADYEAYMSSMKRVRQAFDPDEPAWPTADVSVRHALADLAYCEWEHHTRNSFSYGIFNLENTVELGCIYIHQTWKPGFDAQLMTWVRESEADTGLDEDVFSFAQSWAENDWPFEKVACPGRTESWEGCSRPLFVPDAFDVPEQVDFDGFRLRLMTMEDVVRDYPCYMADIEHLKGVFGPNGLDWPTPAITPQLALADLGWTEWEHFQRTSFTYAVLPPDGSRQMGCVYLSPTERNGYDVEVCMWVTSADHANGFDAVLFDTVRRWVDVVWPFENAAYPGHLMSWDEWDAC